MKTFKPISRGNARERGLDRYFTGKPCKRGHMVERYLSNGECVACATLIAAQWQKTPKGKAYQRQFRRTPKMLEYHRQYDRKRYLKRKRSAP